MLGKTQPFLEYLSNELSNKDEGERKVWQEFFDSLKMKEDIKFDKISSYFTKIMSMFAIYLESRDGNSYEREGYYIPEISQMTFSAKVPAEIRVKYDSFFKWINEQISDIKYIKAKKDLEYEYDDDRYDSD